MKKAAIYSRKSIFTGKGESIENQIEMCKDYYLRHYGDNVEFIIYEDEGQIGMQYLPYVSEVVIN